MSVKLFVTSHFGFENLGGAHSEHRLRGSSGACEADVLLTRDRVKLDFHTAVFQQYISTRDARRVHVSPILLVLATSRRLRAFVEVLPFEKQWRGEERSVDADADAAAEEDGEEDREEDELGERRVVDREHTVHVTEATAPPSLTPAPEAAHRVHAPASSAADLVLFTLVHVDRAVVAGVAGSVAVARERVQAVDAPRVVLAARRVCAVVKVHFAATSARAGRALAPVLVHAVEQHAGGAGSARSRGADVGELAQEGKLLVSRIEVDGVGDVERCCAEN